MNNDTRTAHILHRLFNLTPADFTWVQSEALAQARSDYADGIGCDMIDYIENALDLAADPTYIRD